MARVYVKALGLLCAVALAGPAFAKAVPKVEAPVAVPARPQPPGYDAATGQRSYSQHAFTKIRPGSYLHDDKPIPQDPDFRSELEHRRDAELVKHYGRMAEFDVIADVAEKAHDLHLQERVDEVRRKETQRHHEAMQLLHHTVWRKLAAQAP